ncbi:MAG: SUMF1/EgtB/PvdO family nonheme iron enzyme [Acidobacteriota bacterium]
MPERRHLKVFIASPGDVQAERELLEKELQRFNRSQGEHYGVQFDPWRWEADVLPQFSEDIQADLCNPHVDDADVVVVIVWQRLGSPTARADSGTAEEFDRAFARWKKGGEKPHLLFYRSRVPAPPTDEEWALKQQLALGQFVKAAQKKCVTSSYESLTEFADLVRDHVPQVARKLGTAPVVAAAPPPTVAFDWTRHLELIEDEHGQLSIPGLEGQSVRSIGLERLYVRLEMQGRGGGTEGGLERHHRRVVLSELLAEDRVAVVGDPGAGKTTILRHLALRLARLHLDRTDSSIDDLGLEAGSAPRPLFLRLAEVADRFRDQGRLGGKTIRPEDWGPTLDAALSSKELVAEALLEEGGLLVLFDGLDEIANRRDRDTLGKAVAELARRQPGPKDRSNRFVVTCRSKAWAEGRHLERFSEVNVLPLDDEGIERFVERWCRAVADLAPDTVLVDHPTVRKHRDGLLDALRNSAPVRRIATNPQMLTMLAVLHHAQKSLPAQRALLYERCVDFLVECERHQDVVDRWGGSAAVKQHLVRLAVAMQEAVDVEGEASDSLELGEAVELLASELDDDRERAAELLHELEIHVGLLLSSEASVRFQHRTFQEFLVARSLADSDSPAKELGKRALDPAWAEVTTLTAGVLAMSGPKRVRAFLQGLVGEPGPSPTERAPRVAAAALCLEDLEAWGLPEAVLTPAREGLEDVLPVLTDPKQEADLATRVAVATGLGRVKDPRLTEDARWVEVPAGESWQGAAPGDDAANDNEESGRWITVSPFRIQRWAVTVGEYRRFVEDKGYTSDEWWCDEGRAWRDEESHVSPDAWKRQLEGAANVPITGVCVWEAEAYCAWLQQAMASRLTPDEVVRLPREAEWEKAARGLRESAEPQRIYSWGDAWQPDRVSHRGSEPLGLHPVGCFPAGHGPLGTWDQAGNVWEWCADGLGEDFAPYETLPTADPVTPAPRGVGRVVRGGSWIDSLSRHLRVSYRDGYVAGYRNDYLGFRVVVSRRSQDT